jgi:TctA family transporter
MDTFAEALTYFNTGGYWVAVLSALGLSIIVSVIPGVSSIMVMAVTLPFILIRVHDPVMGIVMLSTIVGTNQVLDSVPAILLGLPQSSTQVTFLEGHQIARRGKAAHLLGAVFAVSAIGSVVGSLVLAGVIPMIRPFVLGFSFGEIAVIALSGLAMVSILSRGAMIKGLTAATIGLMLGVVGAEAFTGSQRYIYGWWELTEGLPIIAVVTGIFALPEILDLALRGQAVAGTSQHISQSEVWSGFRYGLRTWKVAIRQSLFGVGMGAIPGIGSGVIDWLSYAFGMIWSKDRSQAGKGWLDGVLFTESAQCSKEAGQAIPALALGLPGGAGWVLVIVAMLAYGISPGPQMLGEYAHLTIVMVISLALGNVALVVLGLFASRQIVRLTVIPYAAIAAIIGPLVILTAYVDFGSWIALPILFIFTGIGLVMKIYGWPRPPLILGFILGPIIESNLYSGISVHGVTGLLTRPLTISLFIAVTVATVLLNKAMATATQTELELDSSAAGLTGTPTATATAPAGRGPMGMPTLTWRWENMVPLALMVLGTIAIVESMDFRPRAQPLPMWTSIGMVVLSTVLFIKGSFVTQGNGDPAQIMDLGLISRGAEGAQRRVKILAGLFGLFFLVALALGLPIAALTFAGLTPIVLMEGKYKWLASIIAVSLVSIFIFFFANYLMGIIWPAPAFQTWWLG